MLRTPTRLRHDEGLDPADDRSRAQVARAAGAHQGECRQCHDVSDLALRES